MGTRYEIRSPVEDYAGDVAGVLFTQGIGHTDDPSALAYFHRHGYSVTQTDEAPAEETKGQPAKSASKAEWKSYAIERGMDEDKADALTRDQLVDHFTGA